MQPISAVTFKAAHCPACGGLREIGMTHTITGQEDFLQRTLASVGVPPLHILRAYNSSEYRFYELNGDLKEALHFNDFEKPAQPVKEELVERIHLGEETSPAKPLNIKSKTRIKLSGEER